MRVALCRLSGLAGSHDERWRHLAVERLKFRCYQCNQLLASSPGKAGSIVSCPRCKADLVVPATESQAPGGPEPGPAGKSSGRTTSTLTPPKPPILSPLDEIAAAIPSDLADLRPEDLRVEAEFFQSLARPPEPPREPEPFPLVVQEPPSPFPSFDPISATAPAPSTSEIGTPAAQPQRPETQTAVAGPADTLSAIRPHPEVPPIEIEQPSLVPSKRATEPIREVILPASVVLAWSLFGLIGIATSFIAGLMVGHYVWRM
jgi:hypothetical protein